MTKPKTEVRCQECGHLSPQMLGRCPSCGGWGTFVEETVSAEPRTRWRPSREAAMPIAEISTDTQRRTSTGISELDRVLGGGVMPGSLVLIGGEPGIGKSTLLLQAASAVAAAAGTVLMVSAEESAAQVRLRGERVGALDGALLVLSETDITGILNQVRDCAPYLVVIDSIQTIFHPDVPSAPGSVAQVRECTAELVRLAKTEGVTVFVVGHVTKDGSIAGPRVLEHMVDTVLYFEGDGAASHRIVRAVKNRYGPTDEIGVFEMTGTGLTPVANPSELFLAERPQHTAGSVVLASVEGTRCLLVEVQALVSASYLSMPRRQVTGVDANRLSLNLAVLERAAGLRLGDQDVYVNVAGGVRVTEPAADMAVAVALASAHREKQVPPETIVAGEVGLSGEIRRVPQLDQRLKEAARLGFTRAIVPRQAREAGNGLEVLEVATLREAVDCATG